MLSEATFYAVENLQHHWKKNKTTRICHLGDALFNLGSKHYNNNSTRPSNVFNRALAHRFGGPPTTSSYAVFTLEPKTIGRADKKSYRWQVVIKAASLFSPDGRFQLQRLR